MKKIIDFKILFLFLFGLTNLAQTQIVKGKLVDHDSLPLSEVSLYLYSSPDVFTTITQSDGRFYFDLITNIEEASQLPSGYSITNNFPNPFNPKTTISLTLPAQGNVKLEVYNILGQRVMNEIERYFSSGTHLVDIELQGMPSGIYIAQITIDNRYTVVKKMMLIYGSKHLSVSANTLNNQITKSNINSFLLTGIDSLVATSLIIGRKTFTALPGIVGDTLDIGELIIERYCPETPTVTYEGKVYNTVKIGNQCWLKENLDVGTMIPGKENQTDNGVIEKYCYENDPNNCNTYGALYQCNEAMQYVTSEGTQGICPPGWHMPSIAEFQTLSSSVANNSNSLKVVVQGFGGSVAPNSSGFSAFLSGYRYLDGYFYDLDYDASFWSSTQVNSGFAYNMYLCFTERDIGLYVMRKAFGFCIRCIKD